MALLNRLFYYGLILPLSRLSFKSLYILSDGLFFIIYRVVGYRKKVARDNIERSFPDRTTAEHRKIEEDFYRHFCDLIVESLKTFTITKEEVQERMKVAHEEIPNRYFQQGKSIIIAGGHYNNWELFAVAIDDAIQHQSMAVYKPLTNTYFDGMMQQTRSKYGLQLIHNRKVKEVFEAKRGERTATIFAIDQSPSYHSKPYWTTFLHQDTAVLTGTEKYAKDYNYPVVFCRIKKLSRGHYCFEFDECIEDPSQTREGEITEKATAMLEKDIQENAAYWLWSHRRWKHQRPTATPSQA